MGWHIRFAAFKGTGVSDRGDSIHRPFWSAFLYNLLNSYSMFLFSIHRRSISRSWFVIVFLYSVRKPMFSCKRSDMTLYRATDSVVGYTTTFGYVFYLGSGSYFRKDKSVFLVVYEC